MINNNNCCNFTIEESKEGDSAPLLRLEGPSTAVISSTIK